MRQRQIPALAVVVALAVAGCGGGSSSSSSTSTSSAVNAAGGGARRAAITACLRKQGVTPPQRGQDGGLPFGGGQNRQRIQQALRKCGITLRSGRRFGGPQARQAIQRFVACVRSNGYNLPAPNTSGNGPVLDPSKVNRNDPKFQAAARKCQGLLRFPRRFGTPGASA